MPTALIQIATADVILSILCILVTLWVIANHGLDRHCSWLYVLLFATIRLAGGGCQVACEQNCTLALLDAMISLRNSGVLVLFLALVTFLQRMYEYAHHLPAPRKVSRVFSTDWLAWHSNDAAASYRLPSRAFLLLGIPFVVSVILLTVAETIRFNVSTQNRGPVYVVVQVGTAILVVSFVLVCCVLAFIARPRRSCRGETRIVFWGLLVSLNLLVVRTAYWLIGVYNYDTSFSPDIGNMAIRALMAAVPEYIVEMIFVSLGLLGLFCRRVEARSRVDWPFRRIQEIPLQETGRILRT